MAYQQTIGSDQQDEIGCQRSLVRSSRGVVQLLIVPDPARDDSNERVDDYSCSSQPSAADQDLDEQRLFVAAHFCVSENGNDGRQCDAGSDEKCF